MDRRQFVSTPLLAAPLAAASSPKASVYCYGDGVPHTPAEYAQLLASLTVATDDYARGGVVEQLEQRMAAMLGKETAVWLPTGTLANHLAVRQLAGNKRRVLVQAESHLFQDCGDCAQTLSGLHLVPLAPGQATFTLEQVEQATAEASGGRVLTPIGAIQIESPVRRRRGEVFQFEEMRKISVWARERGIGMHLDGARLLLEAAYTKRPLKAYAALFDTVYISQYKYFNAAFGAILAGPKSLLEGLYHQRRMFGGAVHEAWPGAAVALHYLEGFEARMSVAVANAEGLQRALAGDARFVVERVANGTNISRFQVKGVEAEAYRLRLAERGFLLRPALQGWFALQVNETWGRVAAEELIRGFGIG